MKITVRCGVDGHGQRIGAIRFDSEVAHFERLPPTETLMGDRYDEPYYTEHPKHLRRLKMAMAKHPTFGYGAVDGDDPPPQRFSFNKLVTSWRWLDPEDAAALLIEPMRGQLWMDINAFWSGTADDWLHYWCPRHNALALRADDVISAIRDDRKEVLAGDITEVSS